MLYFGVIETSLLLVNLLYRYVNAALHSSLHITIIHAKPWRLCIERVTKSKSKIFNFLSFQHCEKNYTKANVSGVFVKMNIIKYH